MWERRYERFFGKFNSYRGYHASCAGCTRRTSNPSLTSSTLVRGTMKVFISNGNNIETKHLENVLTIDATELRQTFFGKYEYDNEKILRRIICGLTVQALEKNYTPIIKNISRETAKYLQTAVGTLGEIFVVSHKQIDINRWWPFAIADPDEIAELRETQQFQPNIVDRSLPKACIFDLDGTLALIGSRNPYDASKCHTDEINTVVKNIINSYDIAIGCTGRPDIYREPTEKWLNDNEIKYKTLLMRPTSNKTPDSIMKYHLFDKHIRNNYNVTLVLEDRSNVVRMWRSLGLTTFQVGFGDF